MKIGRAAVVTDTGKRRLGNEDAYVFEPPLFAIADGMGGARAGEIAADLAASALEEASAETREAAQLSAIIAEANRRVWERSRADPETAGMGTTVTIALVDASAGTISFGHVGDSRAYRLRDGVLEQVTTDHSLVAELVESGVLTPEEAERHPQRSAITKAARNRAVGRCRRLHPRRRSRRSLPRSARTASRTCSRTRRSPPRSRQPIATRRLREMRSSPRRTPGAARTTSPSSSSRSSTTTPLNRRPGSRRSRTRSCPRPASRQSRTRRSRRASRHDGTPAAAKREPEPIRHGAGAGGRVAALALIVAVLAIGLLVLYLAVR